MSVGSGLNPVLDYADIRRFIFSWIAWMEISPGRLCVNVQHVVPCYSMFFSLFILLYYLVLMFNACHMSSVRCMVAFVFLYTTLRLDPSLSGLRHCLGSNESVE